MKVTARSTDTLTVTRAQEGTAAKAFAAGSRVEQRVTAQSILDTITSNSATLAGTNSWTGVQTFAAATTEVAKSGAAAKFRIWDTTLANYHGFRNVAGVLTLDYTTTDYLTVTAAGVAAFVNPPKVGTALIHYVGGTDVAVADGGTGASTAAAARTNLGIVLGTDVQTYSTILANIAALTLGANKLFYATAATTFTTTDLSAFGITLIDDADAATARTTLGLGTMSTQAASAVAITGGTISGVTSDQSRVALSSESTGVLTTSSANAIVQMSGDVTLTASVFSANDIILFYTGAASRTFTQGSGVTMRLNGSATTGTRTGAARSLIVGFWVTATEVDIVGGGVA